jgi:signal transduction histidine kinase
MKWFAGLSIYKKIISVTISSIVLLSLLMGFLVWNSLETALAGQFEKRGVEIAARLASLSSEHILFNDPFALYEVANEVKNSSEDIRYILITDHLGHVLAHTFQGGLPTGILAINDQQITLDFNIESIDTDEGVVLDIMVPIEHGKVGYARVGLSERYIRSLIQEKLQAVFLITLLVCSLAVFLTARMTAYITRPLTSLAHAAKDIADGNLSSKVAVRSDDEVGRLTASFNNMADSLISTSKEKDELLAALQEKERLRDILFHKLITAQEDERKRISRELHDETSQALTSLIVSMRLLADETDNPQMHETIRQIREITVRILNDVRNLAVELRPPVLDDLGLSAAMHKYADQYQDRFGITVTCTTDLDDSILDKQVVLTLYRIMQECLTNIARHSGAKSARVLLEMQDSCLVLAISDDGKGINQEALNRARNESRIGLYGMQERTELLGGSFYLASGNSGTTVTIIIPSQQAVRKEDHSHD